MINRACTFSNRPYTSQIEENKFLRLHLCTLKLAQKIQVLVYFLYNLGYGIITGKIARYLQSKIIACSSYLNPDH